MHILILIYINLYKIYYFFLLPFSYISETYNFSSVNGLFVLQSMASFYNLSLVYEATKIISLLIEQ
jgi:hypothetical protein